MSRRLLTIAGALLFLVCGASAQAPSPEAMNAARKLVVTLKIADQYRVLLPQLLLKLRPVVAQDRPEIERDYDALTAPGSEIYAPFVASMIDQIAALYAASFTLDDARQRGGLTATYRSCNFGDSATIFSNQGNCGWRGCPRYGSVSPQYPLGGLYERRAPEACGRGL